LVVGGQWLVVVGGRLLALVDCSDQGRRPLLVERAEDTKRAQGGPCLVASAQLHLAAASPVIRSLFDAWVGAFVLI